MYGDPTTTPGGKALKFYCSVRCQISRVGGSQEKIKVGGEEVVVGHTIRAKVVKNKVAPPFRKAEFPIWYDGRKTDPVDEIAAVALLKGLVPKFDAQGNPSPTGRTYLWPTEPLFKATKKDDVAKEIKKFPKVQEELVEMIKGGIEPENVHESQDFESEMSEEEFEEMIRREAQELKNGSTSEAEETETEGWDSI